MGFVPEQRGERAAGNHNRRGAIISAAAHTRKNDTRVLKSLPLM